MKFSPKNNKVGLNEFIQEKPGKDIWRIQIFYTLFVNFVFLELKQTYTNVAMWLLDRTMYELKQNQGNSISAQRPLSITLSSCTYFSLVNTHLCICDNNTDGLNFENCTVN